MSPLKCYGSSGVKGVAEEKALLVQLFILLVCSEITVGTIPDKAICGNWAFSYLSYAHQ